MEDQEIIDKLWERKEEGLLALTKKYQNYCHTVSYGILRNAEDVEECVNDTWMRVWNAIPPHRPNHLAGFLAKIVRNLSLNYAQKQHAQKRGGYEVSYVLEELSECVSDGKRVEERIERQELVHAIEAFLRQQTQKKRIVFLRRYFYMDSVKEIAEKLELKEGTVKSILSRMRNDLQKWLEKEAIYL
ncbi:MAG: RNA polymerase sigma factor [Eubacteriales bacterium]|nr:RNA polymerase sigma factor [Eubacteriales bacterium]